MATKFSFVAPLLVVIAIAVSMVDSNSVLVAVQNHTGSSAYGYTGLPAVAPISGLAFNRQLGPFFGYFPNIFGPQPTTTQAPMSDVCSLDTTQASSSSCLPCPSGSSGTITSPVYPTDYTSLLISHTCHYVLTPTTAGQQIQLTIATGAAVDTTQSDYLRFSNGDGSDLKKLETLTMPTTSPQVFTSTSAPVKISFSGSDNSVCSPACQWSFSYAAV